MMKAGHGVVCGENMMIALSWCGLRRDYDDGIIMVRPVEGI